jgi:hypothetical protein
MLPESTEIQRRDNKAEMKEMRKTQQEHAGIILQLIIGACVACEKKRATSGFCPPTEHFNNEGA